jgi:AraC-like DNA-binding protein
MENEKPYLDCDLTIYDLSEELDISRHYLTQIINEKINKNFYDFINEYRLNESIRLMTEEKSGKYTILQIAFDAGFKSKSSFNSIFKRLTQYTPTQYMKLHGTK